MTDKETGELRRRYKPDRTNITAVYGCYVSGSGEILSEFRQPVALMSEEDKGKYLALLKKVSPARRIKTGSILRSARRRSPIPTSTGC